jgi:predicted nucleic acid-binding protein
MAKLFLDVNILIDLIQKRSGLIAQDLKEFDLFISPLSIHILLYVTKKKIPSPILMTIVNSFFSIAFDEAIMELSLEGPTADFEDNVQLHSAQKADCEIFLTFDKELLKMKKFGVMEITNKLP